MSELSAEPPGPWETFQRISEMAADIRSIRQSLDEKVIPTLTQHEKDLEQLRSRFVYALTMIGSSIGAVTYLVLKGGSLL